MSIKIAYQGRPGAYSHLACIKAFPNSIPVSCETFEEVFEKTQTNETNTVSYTHLTLPTKA